MADLQLLYHGNCLDGVLSAAVFRRFYLDRVQPGARVTCRAMAHSQQDPYGEDHDATFHADVNAVLDFRYSPSPRLNWWCDHHHTAFLQPEHQQQFEADTSGRQRFDPAAPSCVGLLWRWLGQEHGWSLPLFEDHVRWGDLVDAARFDSPAQAVELAEPALRLMALLEHGPGDELCTQLITDLGHQSIAQVADQPRIKAALGPVLAGHAQQLELFRRRLQVRAGVATFDLSGDRVDGFNKFIPYHLVQGLRYTVGLTLSAQRAKVSVGSNPWDRPDPLTNIGELCQRYGGGGHAVVGAVSLPPQQADRARQAFEEISAVLRAG